MPRVKSLISDEDVSTPQLPKLLQLVHVGEWVDMQPLSQLDGDNTMHLGPSSSGSPCPMSSASGAGGAAAALLRAARSAAIAAARSCSMVTPAAQLSNSAACGRGGVAAPGDEVEVARCSDFRLRLHRMLGCLRAAPALAFAQPCAAAALSRGADGVPGTTRIPWLVRRRCSWSNESKAMSWGAPNESDAA